MNESGKTTVYNLKTRPAGRANIVKSQLKWKHANEAVHQNSFHKQFSLIQENGGREVLAPYAI